MEYIIREIEEKDNKDIENVIRNCLIEFGANHEGTAWTDPDLGKFSEIYNTDGNKYWVAENEDGKIVGGVGIGKLDGIEDVCELQKMYCLPESRGTGVSHKLMDIAIEYAKQYYERCCLETLQPQRWSKFENRFWSNFGAIVSIKIHKFVKNRIKMR